jgi:hypothetical protein
VFPKQDGDDPILPFLQYIFLERVVADGRDWTPLTTFLSRRASPGNRLDSLEVFNSSFMRSEEVEDIGNTVRDFRTNRISRYDD